MAKTLKDLEFKDNFMFSATMLDSENCRIVLERILEFPIERVERLRTSVLQIKQSREMEGRYMLFEELQEQNYLRGKIEDVLELLSTKGNLPDNAETIISGVINADNARDIFRKAVVAESVEGFFDMLSSK